MTVLTAAVNLPSVPLASNFLVPNGTFFAELIGFLLLLFVFAKWVLPPLDRAMTQRQEAIRTAFEDAERAREEADAALERYRTSLDQARQESARMLEEARKAAEQIRRERVANAEQEAERIVARARDDVDAAKRQAIAELRRQVADLAVDLAGRIIGEALDMERQRGLIDRYIAALDVEPVAAHGAGARVPT